MKKTHPLIVVLLLQFIRGAVSAQVTPPTGLHDSVPYQGAPILHNPIEVEVSEDQSKVFQNCDWPNLLDMVRDLEIRIATALEVDTAFNDYSLTEEVIHERWKQYDCFVLRDSVLSLQVQLDEALASEPTVETRSVLDVAQTWAKLRGAVIDDGNADLQLWGFKWGTDSTLTDSLVVPFEEYENFLDTSALDTGSFVWQLPDLTRYTQYFFAAFGSNEEGPGYGDTLTFTTLPDLADGLSLDTSDVVQNSATLKLSIDDAGGQGPDDVQFYYSAESFIANAFSGDSLASDSTGGSAHSVVLSGLTRYTDYYFNVMVENLAGRAYASENMMFKTLPDLATLATPTLVNDTLSASITDNGGQTPTEHSMRVSKQSDLSNATTLATTLTATKVSAPLPGLDPGTWYYVVAVTKNNAGSTESASLQFATEVDVTTNEEVSEIEETSVSLSGEATFGSANPSAVGFIWSSNAELTSATTANATLNADGTFSQSISGLTDGTTYYFSAYATNGQGTTYGDTLSFTKVPPFLCGTSTVTFDSYAYTTVEIGDQCWFAENLRTTKYADGSAIPEVTDGVAWGSTSDGARVAYDNDASKLTTYGYLYNWYAVDSDAELCPSGWHVPTDAEWTTLTDGLGGSSVAGVAMKSSASENPSWNGNNSSGFSGLPGGYRDNGNFVNAGNYGYWWSSSPNDGSALSSMFGISEAWIRVLGSSGDYVNPDYYDQRSGFSVRCVRD